MRAETRSWHDLDLPAAGMDASLNGHYIKSGQGRAAMGHPVTSLTWMLNWALGARPGGPGGEIVNAPGTCSPRRATPVRADFGPLGVVEASFA